MSREVTIKEFMRLAAQLTIIDVRSENEFDSGHIPGAVNIPVLNNEERVEVGKTFKREGRERAVLKGLGMSGPHLKSRLDCGVKNLRNNEVLVHCWRGGMRSGFYSYLLSFYGAQPIVLKGGYKSYRRLAYTTFNTFHNPVFVLSGKTGSGKTDLLKQLQEKGEQVIDLEFLAKHRGSSFGALAFEQEVTQEQFENDLFDVIYRLDPERPVWIEDEGRTVGRKVIPEGVWNTMLGAKRIVLERSYENRLQRILDDYGFFDTQDLIEAMKRIGKRLGPQHVKRAVEHLESGEHREAFAIALNYYDRAYAYLLDKHDQKNRVHVEGTDLDPVTIADALINSAYHGKN